MQNVMWPDGGGLSSRHLTDVVLSVNRRKKQGSLEYSNGHRNPLNVRYDGVSNTETDRTVSSVNPGVDGRGGPCCILGSFPHNFTLK